MNRPQRHSAIKSLLLSALMLAGAFAHAADSVSAGAVMHTSGPLLATKADGGSRILAPNSAIAPGDTLVTQKNGYAQIRFSDGSLLILQPGTTLTIDKFSYDAGKPEADEARFTLQQGGIRSNAGLLGKRSMDRVTLTTPVATVALQNASAIIQYQTPDAAAQVAQRAFLFASTAALDASLTATRSDAPPPAARMPLLMAQMLAAPPTKPNLPAAGNLPGASTPPPPPKPPGLYVQVLDGLIKVGNTSGSTSFTAGQFGYTSNILIPPVIVPKNPGILFTPPASFSQSMGPGGPSGPSKPNAVNCEVR